MQTKFSRFKVLQPLLKILLVFNLFVIFVVRIFINLINQLKVIFLLFFRLMNFIVRSQGSITFSIVVHLEFLHSRSRVFFRVLVKLTKITVSYRNIL